MIVYNHGTENIYIVTNFKICKFGGPAEETRIIIAPNDGIDLDILNLKQECPHIRVCRNCQEIL